MAARLSDYLESVKGDVEVYIGFQFVTGLIYEDLTAHERKKSKLDGVFAQIVVIPDNEFAKDLVKINQYGEIVVNDKTSIGGIWAVGNVTSLPYKQNIIAMGDAVIATLNLCDYLMKD
jgi:alkyl hydroperoxide reductase subunit F